MPNSKRHSSSVELPLGGMNEDDVVASLPDYVTQMFNEVGFAKYDKDYNPVLFLNPFYVSKPPEVRVQWQSYYDRFMKSKKMKMAHLVFWYGSDPSKPEFSTMPPDTVLTYEQAANLGLNEVPEKITKKIAKGKSLTVQEDMFYFGLKDLEADRATPKEERWTRDEPSDAIASPQSPNLSILQPNIRTETSTGRARKRAKTNNAAQGPAISSPKVVTSHNNSPEATAPETAPPIGPATTTPATASAQLPQSTPQMEAEQTVMIQVTQQGESESQFVLTSPLSTLQDVLDDLDGKEDNMDKVPVLKYLRSGDEDIIIIKEKNIKKWVLKNFMESLNIEQGTIIKFTLEYHDAN
jgi:hypothetical protein